MSKPTLKPCPFCGAAPYEAFPSEHSRWIVACRCGARAAHAWEGNYESDKARHAYFAASTAWNKRATLPAAAEAPGVPGAPAAWSYKNSYGDVFLSKTDPATWHPHDRAGFNSFTALAPIAAQPKADSTEAKVEMTPMTFDDGRKGWYVQTPDFYLDIEHDSEGKWSAYFRDKDGKEAFADQADSTAAAAEGVEAAIKGLVTALAESKGWMQGYAEAIIRDAIDRRTASQATQGALTSEGEDAQRYRWLRDHAKEEPLRPAAYGSEIAPDMRLKHSFPVLVSYNAIGQQVTLDDAIDAARTASLGRVG